MRQIVLDTETTGLKVEEGHRVIEVGCVEMINRKITGSHFHHYINPEREIEAGALAVHGITQAFLKDKPIFSKVADDLLQFISGDELIIHNAPFDLSFLDHELQLFGHFSHPSLRNYCQIVDTLVLARQMHVGQRNSLDALCKRYGIDLSKRELHGALLDAHLLARVYLAMTGGQGSFFDFASSEDNLSKQSVEGSPSSPIEGHHLVVLKALPEEVTAHEAYLEQMKKQGKCLWAENTVDLSRR